jgi:hypothetical protein
MLLDLVTDEGTSAGDRHGTPSMVKDEYSLTMSKEQ